MRGKRNKFNSLLWRLALALLLTTNAAMATFQTVGIPKPGATFPYDLSEIEFIDLGDDVRLPSGALRLGDPTFAGGSLVSGANIITIRNDGTNIVIDTASGTGEILINGQPISSSVINSGDFSSTTVANTGIIRDASGNFSGNVITADGGFSGTILTGNQPNITNLPGLVSYGTTGVTTVAAGPLSTAEGISSAGVLTMTVGGVAIQMGNSRIGGLADAVANDEAVNLGQMNTAISSAVSSLSAAATASAAMFLGAFEIAVPAAAGTTTQTFDSSVNVAFPTSSLDNSTILRAEIVNFTPNIHVSDDQGRFGTTIVTGATSPAFVGLPGNSNNVEFNVDITGAAGNQTLVINVRRAVAAAAPFDTDFTLVFDVYGIKSQCSDGLDNDGDGQADFGSDAQCAAASDNDESA